VGQQVRGHEGPIAVAADTDAIAIADTHLNQFIDCRFGAGHQLLDVMIVGSFARADNRHRRVIENRVTGQQQEQVRVTADNRKAIGRTSDLAAESGSPNSRGYAT